mmetsp:Transcript_116012/g.201423  ORF Transcript_116012/g.201423 Transcript_116012/m.201423 type:complete len:80 (-) Transcript_116012:348-587(-)
MVLTITTKVIKQGLRHSFPLVLAVDWPSCWLLAGKLLFPDDGPGAGTGFADDCPPLDGVGSRPPPPPHMEEASVSAPQK